MAAMNGSTDSEPTGGTENVKDNNHQSEQDQAGQQKKEGPGKSEELTELLVCNGAKCTCDKAVDASPKKLNVLSHRKYIINDGGETKLLATTLENKSIGLNFGQCKVPDPSKPVPCTAKLQWKDYYEKVELPNGAYVLTDKSSATCTAKGGSIKIIHHGQQANVTTQDLDNAKAGGWAADSPLLTEEDIYTEQEAKAEDEDGASVKAITPLTYGAQQPLNTPVTFKASFNGKPTEAARQGVNWVVYDANGLPMQLRSDAGETFTVTFKKAGTYMVEAYGKTNGDKKVTKTYTLKENEIDTVTTADGKLKVRIKETVEFRLTSLFKSVPLAGDMNTITWTVTKLDGAGTPKLLMPAGRLTQVVCDEECSYVVSAYFNGVSKQSKAMQAIRNGIQSVNASVESSRVNETITFSVKDQFKLSPPRADEIAAVKWICKDASGNPVEEFKAKAGETITYKFNKPGEYTVQPYMVQPSSKVAVKIVVAQPEMVSAEWEYPEGGKKNKTGWNEPNRAVIKFKAAEGITVNLEYGYIDKEGKPKATQVLTKVKIPASQVVSMPGYDFAPDREKYKTLLKEGGEFYFKINLPDKTYTILNTERLLPRLKLVTKEEVVSIAFFNGKKPVIQAVFGTQIHCFIRTRNLSAKKVKVQIYRRESLGGKIDALQPDKAFHDKIHDLSAAGTIDFDFTLDKKWEKTGSEKIPYFYAVVDDMKMFGFSNTLAAFNGAEAVAGTEQKEVGVAQASDEDKNNTCPNCKKDIIWDEIKNTFGESDKDFRMECAKWINKYKLDFGINTCSKKAHFLSQIAAETHFSKNEMFEGRIKYTPKNIRSGIFGDRGRLLDKRGQIEDFCKQRPEQINLFNFLYANENGFGNGNGNEASGDGFNFRGKGLIQLTGKGNYKASMGIIKEYFPAKLYEELMAAETRKKHYAEFSFEESKKKKSLKNVDLLDFVTNYDMPTEPKYAVLTALADWKGKGLSNSPLMVNDVSKVKKIRKIINTAGLNTVVAEDYFKKAVTNLKVNQCTASKKAAASNEKGTVVLVSGTDKKTSKDPAVKGLTWVMYKTSVYRDLSLSTFKKLKSENKLPAPDYTTYLSRDTHQKTSSTGEVFKHSDKRFGKYNEIPSGDYFLVPGIASQKYLVYVIDSESKSSGAENGIDGVDGARGGVALHQYCARFSVGCFTFNSGKNAGPVTSFIDEIPDLKLGDNRPVHFIVETRQVKESVWEDTKYGTKKWTGT